MKVSRYSRWDGTLDVFSLDAHSALDALSDLMMHGLDARQAMDYMQQHGFELAGQDFRVMGVREVMQELQRQLSELYRQHNMRHSLDELSRRFEALQEREQDKLKREQGFESLAMNDFQQRRHDASQALSDRMEAFSDYGFNDPQAGQEYRELMQELERLRQLEEFMEKQGDLFQGSNDLDYDGAQQTRNKVEAMEQMLSALSEGKLADLDGQQLGEMLGEQASRSMIVLRDLDKALRREGYLRGQQGQEELTPRAVRRIGAQALASVYGVLRKGRPGSHQTAARGAALSRPDETRPYRFGDSLDVDVVKSVMNSLKRRGVGATQQSVQLGLEDLEVRESDFSTQTTTILLLDLSWSMSFEGRFPAAKRVAMAMDQLIRTRYPRDHFHIVGFSTRARELRIQELPEISWDPSDPFTNLQEGLMVAERLILRHPSPTPQILVITDGQPTAYFEGDELHVEWPSGYGGISPKAVAQTLKQVQRITRRGITINTFMLHDSPELVGFVERMTEINRGRALFTDPAHLGSYLMVDHLSQRRRQAVR